MKILYIDNDISGHHEIYLKSLVDQTNDNFYILPEYISGVEQGRQYLFNANLSTFGGYIKWIRFIHRISVEKNVDVIHFLNADPLIRYFGFYLEKLKKKRIIGTFHHFTYSILRNRSRKIVFSKINCGVVHTEYLYSITRNAGINNAILIDYPVFETINLISPESARNFFGIPNDSKKVIGAIGGTRKIKGLDRLLTALNKIDSNYYLLIAGKEDFFDKEFILDNSSKIEEKVFLCMKYLTDEELNAALNASDIIALPYRKEFDGASGPLAEGVSLGKCIVGPDHGSLGEIIADNNLGYVFDADNIITLEAALESALNHDFKYDEIAKAYQNRLKVETFKTKYMDLYKEQ